MRTIIKNAKIINRNTITEGDLAMKDGFIERVGGIINDPNATEIDASGCFVMPGIIDDQVHFREPGMEHKANIASESRAGVAGGVTSFMEMPNTKPSALTQALLQDKYNIAARTAMSNYSFYMGAGNDNLAEVLKTDPKTVCGIKAFMGSSTGNMLVDDPVTLERLFSEAHMLIATHCEDESTIKSRTAAAIERFGEDIPFAYHPVIRNEEACYLSSSLAVELAKQFGTRLHVLHISTADELPLFSNDIPLREKRITAEACVHHLYFDDSAYDTLGSKIKCNPAIKDPHHKTALFQGLLDDRLDVIATDHAPHTPAEKAQSYLSAPSGLPLIQHSLNIMLDFYQQGKISMERIIEKMCHAPAECFEIHKRGYLDEGYHADVVILDPQKEWTVTQENIYYRCNWSPLAGKTFKGRVRQTFVNGQLVYDQTGFKGILAGQRLLFDR